MSRPGFIRAGWWKKWEEGGVEVVVNDGYNGNTNASVSPRTKARIIDSKKKRRSAKFIGAELQQLYDSPDDTGKRKKAPTKDTILRVFKRGGGRHSAKRKHLVVKELWNARYRYQFAVHHEDTDSRKVVFSDAKKFCLWHAEGGGGSNGYMPGEDSNAARRLGITDPQYLVWRDGLGKALPKEKSKGLFPMFAYGAVGYNCKSKLFILDKGVTNNKVLYKQIFKKIYLPMRKTPPGRPTPSTRAPLKEGETLWMIQDNDPIHYACQREDEWQEWLDEVGISLLTHTQCGTDGSVDTHQSGKYKGQKRIDSFSPYSNDMNATIEKCWREIQYRTIARAMKGEIHSREDHIRVIQEEWKQLEYGEVVRDGRTWKGINWWVDKWGDIMREVQKQDGWDTKYM